MKMSQSLYDELREELDDDEPPTPGNKKDDKLPSKEAIMADMRRAVNMMSQSFSKDELAKAWVSFAPASHRYELAEAFGANSKGHAFDMIVSLLEKEELITVSSDGILNKCPKKRFRSLDAEWDY